MRKKLSKCGKHYRRWYCLNIENFIEEETFTSNQFPILSMEKTKEGASGRAYNMFK